MGTLAVMGALCLLVTSAEAITVNWGDTFFGSDIQSDGTDLDATFTFQIGTFGSFVPIEANAAMWSANWTVLDNATYDVGFDRFQSSFQLATDGGIPGNVISSSTGESVAIGEQVYIWVYDTDVYGFGSEWALITDADALNGDDWTVPDAGDQSAGPLDWRVSLATTPIFGGANDVRGEGTFTSVPPAFDLQTATYVPEPSSALLVLAGLGLFGGRRRRRAKHENEVRS